MKDQLICNRLVVGIRDSALSEYLQLESDLTLDKAKKRIRQREVVRIQQEILHKAQTKDNTSLDAVRQSTTVCRRLPATPQASPKPCPLLGTCCRCESWAHPDTYIQIWRQPASNAIDGDTIANSVYPL